MKFDYYEGGFATEELFGAWGVSVASCVNNACALPPHLKVALKTLTDTV